MIETDTNIPADKASQHDGTKEQTQLCTRCGKDRPVSHYISQRNPAGPISKSCLFCRNRTILSEQKRLQAVKVANTRLEQVSVELAAEVTTRWCSQCKGENPISEYTSTDARRDGLTNTCQDCRKCVARSRKRQRGKFEDEHIIDHNESTAGFEDGTLSSNVLLIGRGPEGDNCSEATFCTDCDQEKSVGDYLEKSSRRVTKLLVFRQGLCIECLQRYDNRMEQGLCGFWGCNWEKKKKTFIDHWERFMPQKL
jgi:hypothetical protein